MEQLLPHEGSWKIGVVTVSAGYISFLIKHFVIYGNWDVDYSQEWKSLLLEIIIAGIVTVVFSLLRTLQHYDEGILTKAFAILCSLLVGSNAYSIGNNLLNGTFTFKATISAVIFDAVRLLVFVVVIKKCFPSPAKNQKSEEREYLWDRIGQ